MFAASHFKACPSHQGVLRNEGAHHFQNSSFMGPAEFFLGRHGYNNSYVRPLTGKKSFTVLVTPWPRNAIANRGSQSCPRTLR